MKSIVVYSNPLSRWFWESGAAWVVIPLGIIFVAWFLWWVSTPYSTPKDR